VVGWSLREVQQFVRDLGGQQKRRGVDRFYNGERAKRKQRRDRWRQKVSFDTRCPKVLDPILEEKSHDEIGRSRRQGYPAAYPRGGSVTRIMIAVCEAMRPTLLQTNRRISMGEKRKAFLPGRWIECVEGKGKDEGEGEARKMLSLLLLCSSFNQVRTKETRVGPFIIIVMVSVLTRTPRLRGHVTMYANPFTPLSLPVS
jgi:hypothetical protein